MNPDAITYLEAEADDHLKAAKQIGEAAQGESRPLSAKEKAEMSEHVVAAKAARAKAADLKDTADLLAGIEQLGEALQSNPEAVTAAVARNVGEAFVQSEAFQALKARPGGAGTGKFHIGPIEMPREFLGTAGIVTTGTGDNADMILPTRIPGIQSPTEPEVVLPDLFGQLTVAGNTAMLAVETVTSNAADVVTEGSTKPASDIGFSVIQATVTKIATVIKVATEMLEDEEGMASYLNGRLGMFVRQKRESTFVTTLLADAGQTSHQFDLEGGSNVFDAILAGIVLVRKNGGLPPDAVVMNSLTAAELAVTKDENERYLGPGPYAPAGVGPWGLRQVIAERIGDGKIVVGAFKAGGTVVSKRGGVTVEATNSNEDDFKKNLTAIRAEERSILFLNRPDAFCIVSETS